MKTGFISHSGIIRHVGSSDLEVMIVSESACSACRSKKVCMISDMKEKIIHVKPDKQSYLPGEKVQVVMEEKMGFYATFLAYVLPFIVMMSILVAGTSFKISELFMGALVILFLALYFVILFLFRNRFEKQMSFKIRKIETEKNSTHDPENEIFRT